MKKGCYWIVRYRFVFFIEEIVADGFDDTSKILYVYIKLLFYLFIFHLVLTTTCCQDDGRIFLGRSTLNSLRRNDLEVSDRESTRCKWDGIFFILFFLLFIHLFIYIYILFIFFFKIVATIACAHNWPTFVRSMHGRK